jgi:hypothetical protein
VWLTSIQSSKRRSNEKKLEFAKKLSAIVTAS